VDEYNNQLNQLETSDPYHTADEKFIALDAAGDDVIVAICTPLMKRVHRFVIHSAELVFVDAGGNMDKHNMRVFLLMTYSVAGGLPLGVLITTNEQATTISRALQLYNTLIDNSCFHHRGLAGPKLFMTDDSTAERTALESTYPGSTLLLCIFHVLQAFWRFLWDCRSGDPKDERPYLFGRMKALVYAESEDALNHIYNEAMTDTLITAHPNVANHIQALYDRRSEWALCCRQDLPIRANNTNNYCERAMRVLKDSILHRTKAFNVPQLVDFITTRFDAHYQRRLQDVANNRLDYLRLSRFVPPTSSDNIDSAKIKAISASVYEVPSEKLPDVMYTVNMFLGSCTCVQGQTGGPCKHQSAVMTTYKLRSGNFLPVHDPAVRQLLYAIAVGKSVAPTNWFHSLAPSSDVTSSAAGQNDADQTTDISSPSAASISHASCEMEEDQTESHSSCDMEEDESGRDEDREAIFSRFAAVCDKIKDMYDQDPAGFSPALTSFCKQAESVCTPSAMLSALHSFGKYSGAASAIHRGRKNLVGLKKIGVQPTAVARQKMPVGGRKRVHLGRPPIHARVAEPGYVDERHAIGLNRQVWPKRKAAHKLADAVSNNESLGRTHSAK